MIAKLPLTLFKLRVLLLLAVGSASFAATAAAQSATMLDRPLVVAFEDPRLPSLLPSSLFSPALPAACTLEGPCSSDTPSRASEPLSLAIARPRDQMVEPGYYPTRPFQSLAVGFTVGFSGLGIDLATPMADRYNLRMGASFLEVTAPFHVSGLPVQGTIHFASARVIVDYAPKGKSFHISPGINLYNRDHFRASVHTSGTQTFTLNDTTYTTDPNVPITGDAVVQLANRAAPRLTIGWGNMIRHHTPPNFTFPFEIGVEYINAPSLRVNLAGDTCDSNGVCTPIQSDPSTQQNIVEEENQITGDLRPLRFFPILSLGVSYKFGH